TPQNPDTTGGKIQAARGVCPWRVGPTPYREGVSLTKMWLLNTYGRVPQLCGEFHGPQNLVQCLHPKMLWRGQCHGLTPSLLPTCPVGPCTSGWRPPPRGCLRRHTFPREDDHGLRRILLRAPVQHLNDGGGVRGMDRCR